MRAKELTKEQKMAIIDSLIAAFKAKGDDFLCCAIAGAALDLGYVQEGAATDAVLLIPELKAIKPPIKELRRLDTSINGWFGNPRTCRGVRLKKLEELKRIIKIKN
jgi:hypothetical protein